ncbi:MAG TPA: ferrous iron transport protein B [Polyangiales bacterium]
MSPRIALIGNPNTGKTSLFNRLTGAQGRVGNYAGVTVELASGSSNLGPGVGKVTIVDVPGTYSLTARSREEQVAIECLLGLADAPRPELVVCCVDASNLARNLYFVLQIQELGVKLVVALTMVDEVGADAPSAEQLSALLECPVLPVIARTGQGLPALKAAMAAALAAAAPEPRFRFLPSSQLSERVERVRAALPERWPSGDALALWALMSISRDDELELPEALRAAVLAELPDDASAAAVDDECVLGRYAWIDAQLPDTSAPTPRKRLTEQLDAVLIHPAFGFVLFLLIHLLVFQSLFSWSDPAIGLIEDLFGWLGEAAAGVLGEGLASRLIVEGVIAGVGSVVVFLPQILLLFFFIGLMEDSGYMARVAYLMDRIMKSMGLHGRAFVPMLSGFACAVPAILATRTMERRRDRLLTMMVVPLMTCSARLPVYTLIIAALFAPSARVLGIPVQGGLMVALYLFSVGTALLAAFVLSKTLLPAGPSPLILELPPYRLPRVSDVLRMMRQRTYAFLSQAGTVILACSVALWLMLNFPRLSPEQAATLDPVAQQTAQLSQSYGGQLGRAIEPALRPLGFDWKIGVGIIGAFAAREVFIATMGVVYNTGDEVDETSDSLRDKLRQEKKPDGSTAYTPLVGLSLLVFFAIACQCMSTLAVVKRETHSYRWPLFMFAYMTGLAWLLSLLVYQGGRLLGFT